MGYWKCPKCGAKDDTYEGTEIVSEQKPSGGFVAVDTEFGMVGGKPSGGSTHKHLTVRKCRKCDIILSDKDYFLTAAEITRTKQMEAREDAQADKQAGETLAGCLGCIGIVFGGLVAWWAWESLWIGDFVLERVSSKVNIFLFWGFIIVGVIFIPWLLKKAYEWRVRSVAKK